MQLFWHRCIYILVSILIMWAALLPLDIFLQSLFLPDVMLCITVALVIRYTDLVPFLLIAVVFFCADIVLNRPLGVWTFLVLFMCELIRSKRRSLRMITFFSEWAVIALNFAVIFFLLQAILTVTFSGTLPFFGLLWRLGSTIVFYPVVVFFIFQVMRLTAPQYNEDI